MNIASSTYDIAFIGIIASSAILALIRGGLSEILSLSSWFITIWLMRKFGNYIDHLLPHSVTNQLIRNALIFIIIFIIVAIIIALIKKLCNKFISTIGLNSVNYLLGIVFGVVRGILISALLIIVIEMLNFDPIHNWQKAKISIVIEPVVLWIVDLIPERMHDLPKHTFSTTL